MMSNDIYITGTTPLGLPFARLKPEEIERRRLANLNARKTKPFEPWTRSARRRGEMFNPSPEFKAAAANAIEASEPRESPPVDVLWERNLSESDAKAYREARENPPSIEACPDCGFWFAPEILPNHRKSCG